MKKIKGKIVSVSPERIVLEARRGAYTLGRVEAEMPMPMTLSVEDVMPFLGYDVCASIRRNTLRHVEPSKVAKDAGLVPVGCLEELDVVVPKCPQCQGELVNISPVGYNAVFLCPECNNGDFEEV